MSSSVKCSHVHANPPEGTKIECARCLREQLDGADNANAELVTEIELLKAKLDGKAQSAESIAKEAAREFAHNTPKWWSLVIYQGKPTPRAEDIFSFAEAYAQSAISRAVEEAVRNIKADLEQAKKFWGDAVNRAEAAEERERRMREALTQCAGNLDAKRNKQLLEVIAGLLRVSEGTKEERG